MWAHRRLYLILLTLLLTFLNPNLAKASVETSDNISFENLSPNQELVFDGSVYNSEAEYYQQCLKALGYTDKNDNVLDIDGYFGEKSRSALAKFLSDPQHPYERFNREVSKSLKDIAENIFQFRIASTTAADQKPDLFGFIYGDITNVHNTHDPFYAIKYLSNLPYVVCAEPGEQTSYRAKRITDVIRLNTKLFGYVNLGPDNPYDPENNWRLADLEKVKQQIDRIADRKWFGVFIDQFGYDFHETRERQNEIVKYAHDKGLHCFTNAWHPEDAMGNEIDQNGNQNGLATQLGTDDYYLIESFLMSGSGYRSDTSYLQKYIQIADYQNTLGVNTVVLPYQRDNTTWIDTTKDIELSYILAQCLQFKGWWFGDCSTTLHYPEIPQIDIGNTLIRPLYFDEEAGKYLAETEKYYIEYHTLGSPYITLKSKENGSIIHIGNN